MNWQTLQAAMPGLSAGLAQQYQPLNDAAMVEFGITNLARSQHWLAQVGHESLSLRYLEEIASGSAYEGRQDLGNTQPGDGVRFKGRGPIQVTGRYNYTKAAAAMNLDLVNNPQLASQPRHAFRISAWWWSANGCNQIADGGPAAVQPLTRRINGGLNGLADRQSRYDRIRPLANAVLPGGATPSPEPAPTEEDPALQVLELNGRPTGDLVYLDRASGEARWFTLNERFWSVVPGRWVDLFGWKDQGSALVVGIGTDGHQYTAAWPQGAAVGPAPYWGWQGPWRQSG